MTYKEPSLSEQNKRLKLRLRESTAKYNELENIYKRLCEAVNYDQLSNSWNKKFLNSWITVWLSPLYKLLNAKIGFAVTANLRNEVVLLTEAIIMQLAILGKFGVQLPYDPRPFDEKASEARKKSQFNKIYSPCVICGETRLTEICHIIPRAHGGPDHSDNYFIMCPLHHHLFDHGRFTKEEWDILENALSDKMESAIIYTKTIHFKSMQYFWGEVEDAVIRTPR